MIKVDDLAWVLSVNDPFDAILDRLKSLPGTASSEAVFKVKIGLIGFRIPATASNALEQFCVDLIALYGQRMIGDGDLDIIDLGR